MASIRDTMKPLTANKHIGRIRRFLNFCVNMEYITINHANKLDYYKHKAHRPYSFSKGEVQMVLASCDPRYVPFYELMVETGLRPCDMWTLTQDNFPCGDSLFIVQDKTDDELDVPISKRAQEIVASLPYRLFPWADKDWTRERGEMDGRVEAQNELGICFAGDREDGCIARGKDICRPMVFGSTHSGILVLCGNLLLDGL